jgi:hypothetical protein
MPLLESLQCSTLLLCQCPTTAASFICMKP